MQFKPALIDHECYFDTGWFARERRAVFENNWLCLGLAGEVEPLPARYHRCGGLVFAAERPATDAPPIESYRALIEAATAGIDAAERVIRVEIEANWKHLIENTLDDCHVGTVHKASLAASFPDWRRQGVTTRHDAASDLVLPLAEPDRRFWDRVTARLGLRRFGPGGVYRHLFLYPACYLSTLDDCLVMLHRIEPVAADRSVLDCRLALPPADMERPGRAAARRALLDALAVQAKRVIEEDLAIIRLAQRGRHYAVHAGVLGAQERRVEDFQRRLQADLASG